MVVVIADAAHFMTFGENAGTPHTLLTTHPCWTMFRYHVQDPLFRYHVALARDSQPGRQATHHTFLSGSSPLNHLMPL